MSAPLVDFESELVLKAKRDEKRKARGVILQKAKDEFEKRERRKELAKQRGEDTWMLPSVNLRLEAEEEKTKSKKHKKEKKKKKKHKKEKKHKYKSKNDKDQSSSSDEDSSEEMEWVVKGSNEPAKPPKPTKQYGVTMPPQAYLGDVEMKNDDMDDEEDKAASSSDGKRDDWMASPFMMATYSRDDIRKEKEDEKEKETKLSMDTPGQSVRELNPFWKDGGTGLPEEDTSSSKKAGVGDGGASWLRRAFQRVQEMAEEQGRSIEEMAAERWGSLEKYYELLAEAEGASGSSNRRGGWRGRGGDRSYNRSRDRYGGRSYDQDSRDRDGSREIARHSDRHRDQDRYKDRHDSRDRERHDRDRDRYQDRRRTDDHEDRNQDRTNKYSVRDGTKDTPLSSATSERTFMKPSDGDRTSRTSSSLKDYKSMFKKPGDVSSSSVSHSRESSISSSSSSSSSSVMPSWKKAFKKPGELSDSGETLKRAFKKPGELSGDRSIKSEKASTSRAPAWKKSDSRTSGQNEDKSSDSRKRHSSSSSKSSSSSSSEDEDESDKRRSPSPPPPPVKILSESEMNQLGAKIVKAELMGNEALAQKLKNKLEAARQARANQSAARSEKMKLQRAKDESRAPDDDDDEVLLTRTDRSGQSWPLPDRTVPAEPNTGRRKKKQKVATHGESGQRERYFADDDELDLKTLVQREKMSSAEDQQKLFSRMAAKSMDKLDMEYTLDDMFVSSAAKKESKAQTEERERSKAIAEHHRMAASLSKCHMCIDSPGMKKHLIIAMGMKVYLCLPATKSLTEGHCLIIPMQHSIASTSLDEDVWSEIQIFRKGLTKMFQDHDKDAIFLETCMNPKKQRHMCMECVPVPKETGDLAPIYFKKAIQESESEWMQNKKLIDTRNKGLRGSVPAGFPFFGVDFGLDGGFAHIIEDEQLFPHYFGKEIIGGMMDVEPMLWRRPHKQNFEDQRKKVLEFADWWKPFDWTQKIER